MKFTPVFAAPIVIAITLCSCIRDEAPGAECDILTATIPGNVLNREATITNDAVTFIVKGDVDVNSLAPEFTITPGATISPASGTVRDFTEPQIYTVTSENGEWSKHYTVSVQSTGTFNLNYNFDHVKVAEASSSSYDVFIEIGENGQETMAWATANPSFVFTGLGKTPDTFPTYQGNDGPDGSKCAVLVTRSTGFFGTTVGKPIAAGNIFIGKFNSGIAMANPLKATQFGAGATFTSIPRYLTGTYSYTPGEKYTKLDENKKPVTVSGKTDQCNIYAVFFDTTNGTEWLDGTNVLSPDNKNIIATAQLPAEMRGATNGWKDFKVQFEYRDGVFIDPVKLLEGGYSLTIVASSSIDGDYFSGAVGSTLKLDNISLVCLTQSDFIKK